MYLIIIIIIIIIIIVTNLVEMHYTYASSINITLYFLKTKHLICLYDL